jgi:CDP-diacylglycerol--glycerol-3-phosphate 3-phosphatidyltransferase
MHPKEIRITISDKILSATLLRLIPARVTPNQLTIFRFFSVPFVILLLTLQEYRAGIVLFALSALTDALDGALARTTNRVTEWGKMYDPMADKLLILSAALVLVPQYLGLGLLFVMMFIEVVLVGSAYYLKNTKHHEIRANAWGKTKMIMQSFGVFLLILYVVTGVPWLLPAAQYFFYAAVAFGAISLITYGI